MTCGPTHKQLQMALGNDRNINVAVGITMVQYRVKRDAAFELLRKSARNRSPRQAQIETKVVWLNEGLSTVASTLTLKCFLHQLRVCLPRAHRHITLQRPYGLPLSLDPCTRLSEAIPPPRSPVS